MMRLPLTLGLLLVGCVGEAEFQLGVAEPEPQADVPGATPQVHVGTFQGMSDGLPASQLSGTASFDGALYTVSADGLYRLPSGVGKWEAVTLSGKASSVRRVDTTLWVTGSQGGLWKMGLGDETFSAVSGAPAAPSYALIKKGSELLLATTSGLMVSADRGASWTSRSTAAIFTQPVKTLVASPAAVRMFALAGSKLWHSDDSGASWTPGLVGGDVLAIEAEAEVVLLQTSGSGALRSDNYGNTFHPLDLGVTAVTFAASGTKAFAGTMSGMRVSDDSGKTWRDSSAGLPAGPVLQLFLAGGALVASTGQAVYVAQVQ